MDYVAHDDDDGAWQFLNRAVGFKMADAMLVGLAEMVKFDSSLRELWDLPYGWCAWREAKGQPWQRARKEARGGMTAGGDSLSDFAILGRARSEATRRR